MIAFFFYLACLTLQSHGFMMQTSDTTQEKQNAFIILGETGVGKSTIGNCILNRNGRMESIQKYPFITSDDTSAMTKAIQMASVNKTVVIDTPGYDVIQQDEEVFLKHLVHVLEKTNTQIFGFIVVIDKNELVQKKSTIFEKLQKLFPGISLNSIIIINKCTRGWLQKERQRNNKFLQYLAQSVNNRIYEFDLKWDHPDDEPEMQSKNILIRQKALEDFITFLKSIHFNNFFSLKVSLNSKQSMTHKIMVQSLHLAVKVFMAIVNPNSE